MIIRDERLQVDLVLCVSLRSDEKRRALLLRDMEAIDADLAARCRFLQVDRDSENPARGCYTSHQMAWRELLSSGARYGLVIEDDAVLLGSSWQACKATANAWLASKGGTEWTFLMLGWMPLRAVRTDTPHVLRVRNGALSHAYIVDAQSPWLSGVPPYNGLAIDMLIANCDLLERHGYTSARTFAVRPMGVIQRAGIKSNIVYRDSCHRAAMYVITCRLHRLAGSAWSNDLMEYKLTRSMCEFACTCVGWYNFIKLVVGSLVLLVLAGISVAIAVSVRST